MHGQTQIRMLTTQSGMPTVNRVGQTTIRPATPVRIQTPLQQQHQQQQAHLTTTMTGGPRHITAQQIRPNAGTTVGHTTIVQTSQQLPQTISTTPPALLPVSTELWPPPFPFLSHSLSLPLASAHIQQESREI